MIKNTNKSKERVLWLLCFFMIALVALFGRMFYWQIIKGPELKSAAYTQQTKNRTISPSRGKIYDTNGTVLAESVTVETISITPKNIKEKEKTAKGLAEILNLDYETILAKTKKNTADETIAKKLDQDVTSKVREWINAENIKGVNIYEDTKRNYPKGALLAHVLGFCGTDNQGLEGLELKYESLLKGVAGKLVVGTDATGAELPLTDEKYIPPEDGLNLGLTIDSNIQYYVETFLDQAIVDNAPVDYASCVVMNPKNGDVLAMAVSPDYDPNTPFAVPVGYEDKWESMTAVERTTALNTIWKNRVVTDVYEPGSVFKTVTAAIGIEEGVVKDIDSKDFVCTGKLHIEGWDIKCWRYYNPHGVQSLREGLMNSCNPVAMTLAFKVGKEKYYSYLNALKVSQKVGIDLPGEVAGSIHSIKNVTDSTIASAAFGQGFTLTQLNMLTVMCTIANGGVMMQPRIVKEITNRDGEVVQKNEPVAVKQVFSKETSNAVMDMMKSVVSNGTGRNGQVKGYYIAGKTSTAEQGRGANRTYIASFVGIAPADDPQVAVIVNVVNPKGPNGHGGSMVAAPVVANIMEKTLEHLDIEKDYTDGKDTTVKVTVPDVTKRTVGEATRILTNAGLKFDVDTSDSNAIVESQYPIAGETLVEKSLVKLYLEGNDTRFNTTVPNIVGMNIVEATKTLLDKKLNIKISGSGVVAYQSPAAGTSVEQGSIVRAEFRVQGMDIE